MYAQVVGMSSNPHDKQYWGPRLWRLFHLMAEVSDRRDISALWRKWIFATSDAMPCERCRVHLKMYLQTHTIIPQINPHSKTGANVRDGIRLALFKFHNDVNRMIHLPVQPPTILSQLYGGSRAHILSMIQTLFQELKHSWKLDYHEWMSLYRVLYSRVSCGPD